MTTYEPAPMDVMALLAEVAKAHHPNLIEEEVRIGVLMAYAEDVEDEEPKPAIVDRGRAVMAKVRIVALRDRAHGMPDAEMQIDARKWDLLSPDEKKALLDHELTHLVFVVSKGAVARDDLRRPKLKIRPHDVEVGWFAEVAARHGEASQEVQQARQVFVEHGGVLFPHLQERPVVEVPRAPRPPPATPELFAEDDGS